MPEHCWLGVSEGVQPLPATSLETLAAKPAITKVNFENARYSSSLRRTVSTRTDLEHTVAWVDKWFVDSEFSIVHKLLSVQTVAADKSAHSTSCSSVKHKSMQQKALKEFVPPRRALYIIAFGTNY